MIVEKAKETDTEIIFKQAYEEIIEEFPEDIVLDENYEELMIDKTPTDVEI